MFIVYVQFVDGRCWLRSSAQDDILPGELLWVVLSFIQGESAKKPWGNACFRNWMMPKFPAPYSNGHPRVRHECLQKRCKLTYTNSVSNSCWGSNHLAGRSSLTRTAAKLSSFITDTSIRTTWHLTPIHQVLAGTHYSNSWHKKLAILAHTTGSHVPYTVNTLLTHPATIVLYRVHLPAITWDSNTNNVGLRGTATGKHFESLFQHQSPLAQF